MASTALWTVRMSKRKLATTTPGPRKRRRASLPADDHAGFRARLRNQQTLTQILPSLSRPVSFDDGELEEIKPESRSRSKAHAPRLKKRDSTLTQMGFIGEETVNIEMTEYDMKQLAVSIPNLAALPQLDGTYDSPRKPRPSKTAGLQGGLHRKRKSVSLQADESQEYMPTTKRRKGKAGTGDVTTQAQRRRSTRQSSKVPSDPAENFAVFQQKLANSLPKSRIPFLEIKDSTGFDEDAENIAQPQQDEMAPPGCARPVFEIKYSVESTNQDIEVLAVSPLKTMPKTPQKERRYVPSSQSPDSLPPSTKKRLISSGKQNATPKGNPLADLSTNTPSRRPVLDAESGFTKSNPASKKKICTLKLPSKSLRLVRKRVEDSQANIWSVQPTSSPRKGDNQKSPCDAISNEAIAEELLAEIPSTSQVQDIATVTSSPPRPANGETQERLISLSELLGIKRKCKVDGNDRQSGHASRESTVEIRDFVEKRQETPQKATQYVYFLDTQPQPNAGALQTDEGSDFGSPIANDTQFVADVQTRITTSPLRTSDHFRDLNPHDTIRISSSSCSEDDAPTSSLSPHRPVERVEYQNSTTTVLTKDPSSPVRPLVPRLTQRPIAPASLPHPSQVSTQEPSQQLPQFSSVPQPSPARTDRITIKDSSSMPTPLSQLPEYNEDELQLQRELERSQHLRPDDDEEDDYADLDPRSPREVVRFQETWQEPAPHEEQNAVGEPSPLSQHAKFTQNGHVTAARIEDMRKRGLIPPGYQPPAYQVPSPRELLPAWMFEDDDDEEL